MLDMFSYFNIWPSFCIILFVFPDSVVGDGLTNDTNQPDVEDNLSKKLGLKVVLQMESCDGKVLFEDTVSQSNCASTPVDSSSGKTNQYMLTPVMVMHADWVSNWYVTLS